MLGRRVVRMTLVGVLVFTVAGCGIFSSDPGPDDVLAGFLGGLASGDVARAAGFTDSPDAAKAVLAGVRAALAPESVATSDDQVHRSSSEQTATATFRIDWHLPKGRLWTYTGNAQLYSAGDGWKVRWLPSVVHPQLGTQQSIALKVDTPPLAPVLDRDGLPLLAPQTVVGVVVDPAQTGDLSSVAGKLAGALNRYEPSVTKQSILDGTKTLKPGVAYPVVSLRANDYQQVKPVIYDLPGVRFTEQDRLLASSKDFGAQVLPAVRSLVADQAAGRAGWRVVTVAANGDELAELHSQPDAPAPAVTSTLSGKVQAAAESVLASLTWPATIVAVQPSTGELVAVAQNELADAQGPISLIGRYPPGSTFKIVTAAAALSAGIVKVDTPVECPGTVTIGGRVVPNEGEFALGTVPLSTAFAKSCNTTFAKLASELPPTALTDAAKSLGLGSDFVVPGLTTITGSVPAADSVVQRAENGFGQGTVVTSPFGMAVAAATVKSGRLIAPTLLRGTPTVAQNVGAPLRPDVLDSLRVMMRDVVTAGTATGLRNVPDVSGKTGTAQFGDGTNSHGWFVGYAGDLAFSVLLVGGGSSTPAVKVADRFLKALA